MFFNAWNTSFTLILYKNKQNSFNIGVFFKKVINFTLK